MGAGAPRHEPGEKPTTVPRVRARRLVLARALLVLASTAVVLAGLEWYLRFRISAY